MNGVVRSSFKLTSSSTFMNIFRQTIKPENAKQRLFSTFWNASMKSVENNSPKVAVLYNKCNYRAKHSSGTEAELASFLEGEINAEQNLLKTETLPSKIDDFEVKLNGSEVTLTKSLHNETIEINFNVNHSVSEDAFGEELDDEVSEVKSKPSFEIDIIRGDIHLGFTCSFMDDVASDEEGPGDIFVIDEITIYKGEWKDNNYKISGAIIDGTLYDLLMNMLDDKGITNEFVHKLAEFSTAYEHSSYISLLRDLKKFISS